MPSTVMKNLQTLHLLPILALTSFFIKISGLISLHPVLWGPDMAYLGSKVTFTCVAPNSTLPVTYHLVGDRGFPIDAVANVKANQPVLFYLKVTATSEGLYRCRAMTGGSIGVSNSIRLTVVIPASNTRVLSEPFPPVLYEGSRLVLSCNVSKGSHLSYSWFFNRKEVTPSTYPPLSPVGNTLVMRKISPEHAGYYYCMAWSMVENTRRFSSSSEVQVTVKRFISKPRISFSISKDGANYSGNVTCWSTTGSPPVNISLSLDKKVVGSVTATESIAAWFPVAMVPGLDMGVARCGVKTDVQELTSEPVTLEVVPVGGDVKVEVEYLYRADSKLAAARLSCQVSRGTFPYISWLFNNSLLPSETYVDSHIRPVPYHCALNDHRRTLVLSKLGPEESGYYRCRARDSYNDFGRWVESAAVLVKVAEVYMNTIEVLTISFCCFLFLMLVLGVGCVYKMFDHKQAHAHIATTGLVAITPSAPPYQPEDEQDDTLPADIQNQMVEITV